MSAKRQGAFSLSTANVNPESAGSGNPASVTNPSVAISVTHAGKITDRSVEVRSNDNDSATADAVIAEHKDKRHTAYLIDRITLSKTNLSIVYTLFAEMSSKGYGLIS